MDENNASAIERITDLEAELEASSDTTVGGEAMTRARDILHQWVDSVTAVVATPGYPSGQSSRGANVDENNASAIERITDLEAELEASSDTTVGGEAMTRARDILHQWVDSVTAVVATPGVGRVVLIHANGTESRIGSPELPMLLSVPVTFGATGD